MSKTLKINYLHECRDRRLGQIAILLIVLLALMSMLGVLHAADDKSSSDKSERQPRRTEHQPHKAKGTTDSKANPRSVALPTPSNEGQSLKPQLHAIPPIGKPTFTPVFPQMHSENGHGVNSRGVNGHGSSLRMTADKTGTSSSSSHLHKGKSTPPINTKNSDLIRKIPQEESLPNSRSGSNSPVLKHGGSTIIGSGKSEDPKRVKVEPLHRGDHDKTVEFHKNLGKANPNNKSGNTPLHLSGKTSNTAPHSRTPQRVINEHNKGRLHLEKVPTAPKPDLKVIISKEATPHVHKGTTAGQKSGGRFKVDLGEKLKLTDDQRRLISTQHHLDLKPNRNLKHEISRLPIEKNGRILEANLKQLNLQPRKQPEFQTLLQQGQLLKLTSGRHARTMQLNKQFQLFQQGDVARRMNLAQAMHLSGGWNHRKMGVVSTAYSTSCMSYWYPGPSYCPSYCWYPVWSPWVDWCSWDYCDPWCDPRPIYCQPIIWDPSPAWVWWECPTWQPLPVVTCGTWVDVPVVTTPDTDLQMLAVRFIDPGHVQQERGPRYRVWLRNNSQYLIDSGFNVMLLASDDPQLMVNRSESGVRIERIEPGQVMSVDIRLPEEVNYSSMDEIGNPMPFQYLTVQIDSHQELVDTFLLNNGVTLARGDVLPIDPASFAADPLGTSSGAIVNIAGEGFGPEPGQVLLEVAGVELQGEIEGWYDLGVRIRLPEISLTSSVMANVVVIRGDGAAANPLAIEIAPMDSLASY